MISKYATISYHIDCRTTCITLCYSESERRQSVACSEEVAPVPRLRFVFYIMVPSIATN